MPLPLDPQQEKLHPTRPDGSFRPLPAIDVRCRRYQPLISSQVQQLLRQSEAQRAIKISRKAGGHDPLRASPLIKAKRRARVESGPDDLIHLAGGQWLLSAYKAETYRWATAPSHVAIVELAANPFARPRAVRFPKCCHMLKMNMTAGTLRCKTFQPEVRCAVSPMQFPLRADAVNGGQEARQFGGGA